MLQVMGAQGQEWDRRVLLFTEDPSPPHPSYSPVEKMLPGSSCHRSPGSSVHEGPLGPALLWTEAWSSTIP